jgi:outer membrane protein insertion porin family
LRGQIATEESRWWKFLASNDNYDPDRLSFDREQLRRYYVNRGYADFKVISAVAELTPDRGSFYITFTVDEGPRYKFGKIEIDSKIKELPAAKIRPLVGIKGGELYAQEKVQKSIDSLTNAAGTQGYAFAEVHPRITRDRVAHTINMTFEIVQGPRVYIEKIDIGGNSRTLDKVIRREFRLVEGDAFNRVLIDRSRSRIRGLGFFSNVDVKNTPGSQPDRTNITVSVTEASTGSLSLGLGYSSTSQLVGEFSYTEINMFGRGQNLRLSAQISQIQKQLQFSFTEPYFLDRPLAAGFDLYKVQTDYEQATYESNVAAGVLRLNFPISEYSIVGLNYTYKFEQVSPFANAPSQVLQASGQREGSIISFTYAYSDLDDARKPTSGVSFGLTQSFAGFGGSLKYLQTNATLGTYAPLFDGSVVSSLILRGGVITGYDGSTVPFEERYFDGGDTFRGFALAGIGPRDIAAPRNFGAIGGTVHAIGTFALRMPSLLPESYGINAGLFTDFGTLGRVDGLTPVQRLCNAIPESGVGSCIKDNLAFRASAGISVQWKSPFGPVQIDLGIPYISTKYDRPQILHFTGGTGF